jgi:PilZ domain
MDEETGAGAAYLAALKQSTVPQAAGAAPARAPDARSSPETRPGGMVSSGGAGLANAEKRKSPRYQCQGSVHLREVNSGVATWATFTDISLDGCYVEVAASYHVGAALALTIEVNGFRVEVRGEVRVAYPGLGMGISFTKVADQDRERLRVLVGSISQPPVMLEERVTPRSPAMPQAEALPAVANPGATLQAILKFFEDRHVMGREEFLGILRKSQT